MKNFLDIKIYPNQSLRPKNFIILMFLIIIPAGFISIAFYLIGAWPVLGFMGLEIILIYIAFKILFYRNKFYEHIVLNNKKLNIFFNKQNKVLKKIELEPTWLQVKIENIYKNKDMLTLSSHGKKIILGSFLIPEERQVLAKTIRSGLNDWKNQHSV
jgi:uncharacterized membrane protein